jgi:hypothetical protein
MRLAKIVTTTAVPTSLATLLGSVDKGATGIVLQALTGTPFMGSSSAQPFAVPTSIYNIDSLKNTDGLWLSGVGTVAVGVL